MPVIDAKDLRPLGDNILVSNMDFDEQKTSSGIVILSDDGKAHGVKSRWAQVYAIGPDQQDVEIGQWIYIEHGRWTRGVKVRENDREFLIRRVDPDAVLIQSDEKPTDVYVGVE